LSSIWAGSLLICMLSGRFAAKPAAILLLFRCIRLRLTLLNSNASLPTGFMSTAATRRGRL
jgi:hypothetical protein